MTADNAGSSGAVNEGLSEGNLKFIVFLWMGLALSIAGMIIADPKPWSLFPVSLRHQAYWWNTYVTGYSIFALFIALFGGLILLVLRLEPVPWLLSILSLSITLALLLWMDLTAGFAFIGTSIWIRSPDPWRPPIIVPMDVATDFSGCRFIGHGYPSLRYSIDYVDQGRTKSLDLASGVTPTNIDHWLAIMVADGAHQKPSGCGRALGSSGVRCSVTSSSMSRRSTDDCLSFFGQHLSDYEKLELRGLVGA